MIYLYHRSVTCWAYAHFVMLMLDVRSLWILLAVAQLHVRIWPLGRAVPHYSILSSLSLTLRPPVFNNASTGETRIILKCLLFVILFWCVCPVSVHVVFEPSPVMQLTAILYSVTRRSETRNNYQTKNNTLLKV